MRSHPRSDHRSVLQLASAAVNDLSLIAAKEIKLVRAEMSENMREAVSGLVWIVASVALLIPALTGLLVGAGMAIGTIDGIPVWGGILIVSLLAAIGGAVLIKMGTDALAPSNILSFEKSRRSIQRDADTLKDAAQ